MGVVAGLAAELRVAPRRALARAHAREDLEDFRAMLAAKRLRPLERRRRAACYRRRARELVARRWPLIYALARELEDYGQVGAAHADELRATLEGCPEARRRLFRRWRRRERRLLMGLMKRRGTWPTKRTS